MLPSHSSADSNMRKGKKRKRSNASNDTDSMQQGRKRETKHCVREGRWPCHPLVAAATAQNNLEDLALQLGLHGVGTTEVRELGLWIYLKTNEVRDPAACCEARTILDTKLGEADMYQHLSFFGKVFPDPALSDMQTMLHHHVFAKAHAKRSAETQNTGTARTSQTQQHVSTDSLLEMYAEFLERYAQKTCRVAERRMRCIQLKQELQEAAGTESYPYVMYKDLWHNEQGAWSQFLHEKDLEDMWLPM